MAKPHTESNKDKAARQAAKEADFGRYDFVKVAPLMGGISLVLTVLALVIILVKGFNYGIDFAGGTEVQVRFPQAVDAAELRKTVEQAGVKNPSVQSFGSGNEFLIRLEIPHAATDKETNDLVNQEVAKVREALKTKLSLPDEGLLRVDTVGPQVGSELKRNGLLAAFYSFLVILIYVGLRFDYKYAPGAVLCLVHDTIFTLGVFSLLGREFNVQIMAAILTLIGYSLNDTIVTFDRIRETAPLNRDMSLKFIINKAINDMLGRTFLTAGCTMLAVVALYIFGGGVISEIAFTLIIGIVIGTYSSVYVAAPLILVMEKFKPTHHQAA
jgi:preprotein translocase subunit SecF